MPFKDRHRYWVGAMLLIRVTLRLLLTFAANPTSAPRVNLLAIASTSLIILMYGASARNVYKKWYLTLLENSFVFNLGTLAVGTFFINLGGGNQAALVYTSVGVALSQFVGIATIYVYTSLKGIRISKVLREKIATRQQDEVHNEHEDVGYELLEVNRGKPRSLVINFDELREPVLEYADYNPHVFVHTLCVRVHCNLARSYPIVVFIILSISVVGLELGDNPHFASHFSFGTLQCIIKLF